MVVSKGAIIGEYFDYATIASVINPEFNIDNLDIVGTL